MPTPKRQRAGILVRVVEGWSKEEEEEEEEEEVVYQLRYAALHGCMLMVCGSNKVDWRDVIDGFVLEKRDVYKKSSICRIQGR